LLFMQEVIINQLKLNPSLSDKLTRLKNPPKNLYYIGADPLLLLSSPAVAIVGTRKMTPYGRSITDKLSSELALSDVTIISGNALGVDVTAQKASLDQGGRVIAVVPSGLDAVYPATNRAVVQRILAQGGCVISEFDTDHSTPRPDEFLSRNRLIAALSDAVLVTEAAERSGSLNTAMHAKDMNIPIFAVPGPITSSLSKGTNHLIKEGAHIVTETKDILDYLKIDNNPTQISLLGASEAETNILATLSMQSCDTTLLAHLTKISLSELQSALTMLEINSRIEQDSVGNWQIRG
jgi:DNA processing protein